MGSAVTAETLVRRRVLATPGVAQVTVIGGERRQFEDLVDPERLADYGVALSAVEEAMRRASRNTSAGFRRAGGQEYLIMLVSRIRRLREEETDLDLREAVVRGSVDRLVPIVMTALSTGLALLPVALRLGAPGSEIQAPLALVSVCGLFCRPP